MFQIEVLKSQESFTYFKIFKPKSWGKRPADRRRRLIQRFPRIISDASRSSAKYCRTKQNDVRSYKFSRGRMIQCLQVDAMTVLLRIVSQSFRHHFSNVSFRNPFRFPTKPTSFVIARRARTPDAAILNGTICHPGTKHDETERTGI